MNKCDAWRPGEGAAVALPPTAAEAQVRRAPACRAPLRPSARRRPPPGHCQRLRAASDSERASLQAARGPHVRPRAGLPPLVGAPGGRTRRGASSPRFRARRRQARDGGESTPGPTAFAPGKRVSGNCAPPTQRQALIYASAPRFPDTLCPGSGFFPDTLLSGAALR